MAAQFENFGARVQELHAQNSGTNDEPAQYSAFLKDQARKESRFVAMVEEKLSTFVMSFRETSSNEPDNYSFKPMNREERKTIHQLASKYGCETFSYDDEPKRYVMVVGRKLKVKLPEVSLTMVIESENKPQQLPWRHFDSPH